MTNEELKIEIEKTLNAIVSEDLKELMNVAVAAGNMKIYSLVKTVAETIVLSGWSEQINFFSFYLDHDFITFRCACGCGEPVVANVSGYKLAYQIKLVFDAIEKAGFFR